MNSDADQRYYVKLIFSWTEVAPAQTAITNHILPILEVLPRFSLQLISLVHETMQKPQSCQDFFARVTYFTIDLQLIMIHRRALSAQLRFQLSLIFGNKIMITHNSTAVALLSSSWKIRLSARALHCHLATIPSPEAQYFSPHSAVLVLACLAPTFLMTSAPAAACFTGISTSKILSEYAPVIIIIFLMKPNHINALEPRPRNLRGWWINDMCTQSRIVVSSKNESLAVWLFKALLIRYCGRNWSSKELDCPDEPDRGEIVFFGHRKGRIKLSRLCASFSSEASPLCC